MGLLDFFSKMNLATGGTNPNDAIFSGLAALGLQVKQQGMTGAELEGVYNGRAAAMVVDSSAVMGAAGAAMAQAAGTEVAGALGLISTSFGRWRVRQNEYRARSWMRNAQISIRWAIVAAASASGALEIGRSAETGPSIGNGLFAAGDTALAGALQHPRLLEQLGAPTFDAILVDGASVTALWAPPMSEYQKVVSRPEAVAKVTGDVLAALSGVAYVICEGGR